MTHFTRTWSNPSAASTQSASPAGIARVDQSMSSSPSRTRPKNASPGDPRLSGLGTKSTPVMRCSTCTRRSLAATSSWNARGHTGRPPSTLRCTPAIPLPGSPLPHPLSLVLTLPLEVADISSSDFFSKNLWPPHKGHDIIAHITSTPTAEHLPCPSTWIPRNFSFFFFFFPLLPTYGRLLGALTSSHFVSPRWHTRHVTFDHVTHSHSTKTHPTEPPLQERMGSRDELHPSVIRTRGDAYLSSISP